MTTELLQIRGKAERWLKLIQLAVGSATIVESSSGQFLHLWIDGLPVGVFVQSHNLAAGIQSLFLFHGRKLRNWVQCFSGVAMKHSGYVGSIPHRWNFLLHGAREETAIALNWASARIQAA